MDEIGVYEQSVLNLIMAAQTRLDPKLYEGYFKKDLDKIYELTRELDNLPTEADYKSVNDVNLLRAYIREELRRNRIAKQMLEQATLELKMCWTVNDPNKCPLNPMCGEYSYDTHDCQKCIMNYLKSKVEGELPFK